MRITLNELKTMPVGTELYCDFPADTEAAASVTREAGGWRVRIQRSTHEHEGCPPLVYFDKDELFPNATTAFGALLAV